MAAPGVTVTVRDSAPPRSAPTDTSVFFLAGFTEKGPAEATLLQSMNDYADVFGARVTYGYAYDALDVFFREGGSRAYLARTLGVGPVLASLNLDTAAATVSLVVKANSFGDWANALEVEVTHPTGSTYQLLITLDGTLVETSPELTTQQDAVDWSAGSDYVTITLGAGTGIPDIAAAAALTGGTDDHANATEAQWTTALGLFTADLGPGQVAMPGRTTDQAHQNLLAHAADNNRIALIDLPDTATVATLTTAATAARSDGQFGAAFAPWAVVPPVAGGTTRTVPYSAVAAGMMARLDSQGISPNVPAAGDLGEAQYAIGLSQPAWDKTSRGTLNDAGVNVARMLYGAVRTYGYRTLANPAGNPLDLELSNARLVMLIRARLEAIAEHYVFAQIDGRGLKLGEFSADLAGELMTWYNAGSLYGATPGDAFSVDVGAEVNPPSAIAAGQLAAQVNLRISPFAEDVQIFVTKRSITEEVA